jgi:deoxycytidylate deaminase
MTVAFLSSQRSKDPNKQVGAVIASEENLILGALDFESRMSSLAALVVDASRYFFFFLLSFSR